MTTKNDYLKLYDQNSKPGEAFLIETGKAYFYLSENDKYSLTGNKIIIGSLELILNNFFNQSINRLETCLISRDSSLKTIPAEKFMVGMKNPAFVINNCMVISRQISLISNIISKNTRLLSGSEGETDTLCVKLYEIILKVEEEYNKRKFPWLKQLIEEYTHNLSYKKGQTLFKNSMSVKVSPPESLSHNQIEYASGSVICQEGDSGNEMYILNSGAIDIFVDDNKISTIDTPGTPIGETSLFIKEKSSVTIKSKTPTIVTRITADELKQVKSENIEVLHQICKSLAQKYYNAILKLQQINEQVVEKSITDNSDKRIKSMMKKNSVITDLSSLKSKLKKLKSDHKQDFIEELISNFE